MSRPSSLTLTTIGVTPVLLVLVVLDVVDSPVTHWFTDHAFTTSAVVSVLVLLITVLNVDHIARRRQLRERLRVTAAQAAILGRQAQRATDQALAAHDAPSQLEPAGDELRTYMAMLLVSAPLLIDAPSARAFLESAQRLGGLLAYAVAHADDDSVPDQRPRLRAALAAVTDSAQPLLSSLDLDQLRAVASDDDAPDAPAA